MKCSLIFYVRIIEKECINTTNFKVILIQFYFNTNTTYTFKKMKILIRL